ncbi:MAG: WYL domain-containing protein, partial [Bacteroidales bacterium]|nr:WYL domain-containing protein [Bacteroidales bacterium]
ESPAEIILSFDPLQGKYIKTLPLHASQQILEDNTKELRIRLTLYVTHDFIMELLSYGEHLKVIQPSSLAEAMKSAFRNALERYLS